jgi:flagellar protein FlgJ
MSDLMGGLNSIYTNNSLNGSGTNTTANSIENKLENSDLSTATDDQLMEVCKDFESYFVEQMVKSMVKMADVNGDSQDNGYASIFGMSSDSSDSAMSTLTGYYGDKMSSIIADAICDNQSGKGLGLAQTLYEQMKRNYGITNSDVSDSDKSETDAAKEPETGKTESV